MPVVNEIEVARAVDRLPEAVFDRIRAFESYPSYSSYLERVRPIETSESLPTYRLEFAWWRLSFETRTRVVALDPPNRIDWEVVADLDAHGSWAVTEDAGSSTLTLHVEYAPETLASENVSLPFGITLGWVREKAESLIETEATRVLDRIVADIEQ